MSSNSNSSNTQNQNSSNLQWIQQRLHVREQEINALKVQNRHLLEKVDQLEKAAEPNQIDTQFVADEVKRHIDPVVQQLQGALNASFEMIQSTLKGIYQQSQRAQNAVEQMAAHAQGLEIRMNDQRKQDQNFYQDKVFSMIGNFCDRLERQIDVRLKALSVVEMMNARQNEILTDLESLKNSLQSTQRFNEANRADIHRIDRTTQVIHQTLADHPASPRSQPRAPRVRIQLSNPKNSEPVNLNHAQIHDVEIIEPIQIQEPNLESESTLASLESSAPERSPEEVIREETAPSEVATSDPAEAPAPTSALTIEEQIGSLKVSSLAKEDASVILSLLRAEKNELKRVARRAKEYLKSSGSKEDASGTRDNSGSPEI